VQPDQLHTELDELALGGAPWRTLLARLAMAVARPVRLIAADGALLVEIAPPAQVGAVPPPASSPDHDRFDVPRQQLLTPDAIAAAFTAADAVDIVCADGMSMRALAVVAGERRIGAVAIGPGPADGTDVDAYLRAATTAIAIEAVRRDAGAAAVAESAGWLVDELRFGSPRPADDLERVARRYGIRLDLPHAAVVLDYDGPDLHTWATSLTWIEAPVRNDGRRAWSIVGSEATREIEWMHRRLQPFVRGRVRVAAGSVVVGVAPTRGSFELAEGALEILRRDGPRDVVTVDELGLTGVLLAVPDAQLSAFVHRHLGPLLDRPHLLSTLAAWYDAGGSRASVSEMVSIHRNSVGHRMDRIRALLGVDPDAAGAAGDLRAALAARAVLLARAPSEVCSEHDDAAAER
jgi:hypothetical protein